VPDPDWQGGMNFTYRVTCGQPCLARLVVDTVLEQRPIENIVATITGEREPDRWVMVGNHRDAWVFGGADPNSGTASLMGVAKALDNMLKNEWRPRRTIKLLSWDAEEFGLLGSVEWVEEYHRTLANRAVAYINVDSSVTGNHTFRAKSSALLIDQLFNMTKEYSSPDDTEPSARSLYEHWKAKKPSNEADEPHYGTPIGSGSDFTPFFGSLGVPCIDIRFEYDMSKYRGLPMYPSYHTIYDTHNYMTKFLDPDLKLNTIVTKLLLQQAIEIADTIVLPYNVQRYSRKMKEDIEDFAMAFGHMFEKKNMSLRGLLDASEALLNETIRFEEQEVNTIQLRKEDCLAMRTLNDQLLQFEKAFILPEGLPGRPDTKHAIYGTIRRKFFKGVSVLPGVVEAVYQIEFFNNEAAWHDVGVQIARATSAIQQATHVLMDFKKV